MKFYSDFFAKGQNVQKLAATISITELKKNWDYVDSEFQKIISVYSDNKLTEEIFKLPKPHPFILTKQEALLWNIKHTMWHCGQIATLRRVVDKPFDFGM